MTIESLLRYWVLMVAIFFLTSAATMVSAGTDEEGAALERVQLTTELMQTAQAGGEEEKPLERRKGARRPGRDQPPTEPPSQEVTPPLQAPSPKLPSIKTPQSDVPLAPVPPMKAPPKAPPSEVPMDRREEARQPGRERLSEGPSKEDFKDTGQPMMVKEGLPPADLGRLGDLPALPDRWRIVDTPPLNYRNNLLDPYSTGNILKGDRPFKGNWFVNLGLVSDTLVESRYVPTPVGNPTTEAPGSLDAFGNGSQIFFNQTLITELVLY